MKSCGRCALRVFPALTVICVCWCMMNHFSNLTLFLISHIFCGSGIREWVGRGCHHLKSYLNGGSVLKWHTNMTGTLLLGLDHGWLIECPKSSPGTSEPREIMTKVRIDLTLVVTGHILFSVCAHMCTCHHAWVKIKGQPVGVQYLRTMWTLEIKLWSSNSVAITFIH